MNYGDIWVQRCLRPKSLKIAVSMNSMHSVLIINSSKTFKTLDKPRPSHEDGSSQFLNPSVVFVDQYIDLYDWNTRQNGWFWAIAGVKTVNFELQNDNIYGISPPFGWTTGWAAQNMLFINLKVFLSSLIMSELLFVLWWHFVRSHEGQKCAFYIQIHHFGDVNHFVPIYLNIHLI